MRDEKRGMAEGGRLAQGVERHLEEGCVREVGRHVGFVFEAVRTRRWEGSKPFRAPPPVDQSRRPTLFTARLRGALPEGLRTTRVINRLSGLRRPFGREIHGDFVQFDR